MTLLYCFFGLLAIYVIGIVFIYLSVILEDKDKGSFFKIGNPHSLGLFLGFMWPYIIYMHIRGKW